MSNKIRYSLFGGEIREVHVGIINDMEVEMKRRILECAFYDFEGGVVLHENIVPRRQKPTRKVHETEAGVIEKNDQFTYAQMVTNLKKQIGDEYSLKNEINGLRETREGHLLLEIKKGSKETDNIYKKK